MDTFEEKQASLKETQKALFDNLKPKQKEKGIQQVKSLKEVQIVKYLGKGAFGSVSLIHYNGAEYAIKEIDKE